MNRWSQRPEGSNWGDFGKDDRLGRLNLIDKKKVLEGIQYALVVAMEEGHTYLPREILLDKAFEVLSVDKEQIEEEQNKAIWKTVRRLAG